MAVVPATRRSVALPAPRRTPARDPKTTRPQLRVVADPASRRLSLGVVTTLAVGTVFVVLFGLVVFHTVLLQNQQRLDRLDAQVTDAQATYQSLRLQVALLEAPQRIIDVATHKLGMVPPENTTYLTPAAGSGASDPTAGSSTAAADDAPADGAAAWPTVKPYLGAAP